MKYSDARKYTETIGRFGMVLGLDSMRRLLEKLGNPQKQLPLIHVAGTNGKGSVIAYLSEMLIRAGYKTGVYTSPAVFEPLEIYRINGVQMSKETYGQLMDTMKYAMEQLVTEGHPSPTLYELETALAFLYFAREQCELVLVETGLGGALDATNCIPVPLCAVLTSISMDHMGVLGDTLEQIATQKAGIIKEGCQVVSSLQEPCVLKVLQSTCERQNAVLHVVDKDAMEITESRSLPPQRMLKYKDFPKTALGLLGEYQAGNAEVALEVVEQLRKQGFIIEDKHIIEGISQVKWPGRLTRLSEEPLILVDGAHNEGAAMELAKVLQKDFGRLQWCFVVGVLADKDYEKLVELMVPFAKQIYTITPDNPRALPGDVLSEVFRKAGCQSAEFCGSVADTNKGIEQENNQDTQNCTGIGQAVEKAVKWCRKEKEACGIIAFGSFTFLKEFCGQIEKMILKANRIISNPLFLEKMEQLEQLEQNRQFCRHGWEHCMDVARAMALINEERGLGFSKDMLYSTALVHDLGRVEEYIQGIPHEKAGVILAKQILKECGFTQNEITEIEEAVGEHRDVGLEGSRLTKLLKEADKKTRLCFRCKAKEQCKWSKEKMNLFIEL